MAGGYEAVLRIKVIADATQAATGLDKAEAAGGKFGSAMRKAALPAAAAGAAVLAFGKKTLDAASDAQQAQGAIEAVFGDQAKAVQQSADSAAKTMGLSAAEYNNYAALVGTALQNAGMSVQDSVKASNDVMQRGADLSALYGGTTAEAVEAINAAVARSEFDPLEKYGASLNMAAVNAELAKTGQDKLTGAAADAAKKQAILKLVMDKTSKAQGQYAKEADSVAGRQQTATAEFENASAALGEVLLPIVSDVVGQLTKLATWAQNNTTAVQVFAGVVLGLAAAVLAVNAAMKLYAAGQAIVAAVTALSNSTLGTAIGVYYLDATAKIANAVATRGLTAAIKAQTIALLASPWTWVVIGIIAVVAAVILLWKKSDAFRTFILGMWRAIKVAAVAVANALRVAWTATWNAIKAVAAAVFAALRLYVNTYLAVARAAFNGVRTAVGWVVSAVQNLVSWVKAIKVPGAIKDAFNTIKTAVGNAKDAVVTLINKIAGISTPPSIGSAFDTIKSAVNGAVDAVKSLISWLGRIKVPKISIPNPFKSGRSAVTSSRVGLAAATAAPTVRGLSASPVALASTASGGGGVTIVVQGALDPEGVARQIRRILGTHGTRVGITSGTAAL